MEKREKLYKENNRTRVCSFALTKKTIAYQPTYLSVYPSINPYVFESVCPSIYLSICLSSIYLYVCLSIHPSFNLSFINLSFINLLLCLFLDPLSFNLFVHSSVFLSVYTSICQSVCPSIPILILMYTFSSFYPCVSLSIHLPMRILILLYVFLSLYPCVSLLLACPCPSNCDGSACYRELFFSK